MKHYVLCLVDTDEAAQEITQRVTGASFAKEEIYVLTSARENAPDLRGHREAGAGERGSLSEGVGLLAGIGPAVVGGTGHFMGTGRIMDASGSGEIGVDEGGAAAFLGRFGLSEAKTRKYQTKLAEGGILIAVQFDKQKTATVARKIFEEAHTDLRTGRTPVRLAFADHVDRLVAGDCAPTCPE
jgi:hypothetical protein